MGKVQTIVVPDIGGSTDVPIIEVFVKPGDTVAVEDPLITLEGDKATMEIPASHAGVVESIRVKIGDTVSEGDTILSVTLSDEAIATEMTSAAKPASSSAATDSPAPTMGAAMPALPTLGMAPAPATPASLVVDDAALAARNQQAHAGPAVRRFAREFGVDLTKVKGSGRRERILKDDVHQYIRTQLNQVQSGAGSSRGGLGLDIAPPPKVDYARFGEVEERALGKIKKASGRFLHRNWVTVPHVTQFDQVDITELEAFRQKHKGALAQQGVKLTPIVFIMKAVVAALREFPAFNASLSNDFNSLILKKYFHVGVAVDTPDGLVVPVIRDVDSKSLTDLAQELGDVSEKAREGDLKPTDMQGGCFSISSLGGIGGTYFTPIVNVPDVAILGVSKAAMQPVYQDGEFVPRLMLPLSLSYDHRVIDGAEAARFLVYMGQQLQKSATEAALD